MRSSGRLIGMNTNTRSNPLNSNPSNQSSDFLLHSNGIDYVHADYSHLPISQRPISLENKLPYVTTTPTNMISPWIGSYPKYLSQSHANLTHQNPISLYKNKPIPSQAKSDDISCLDSIRGVICVSEMVDCSSNRLTTDGRRQLCQSVDVSTPCPPYCNCCNALDKKERYNNPWTDMEKVNISKFLMFLYISRTNAVDESTMPGEGLSTQLSQTVGRSIGATSFVWDKYTS